jgi:hypothetical protein
MERLIEEYRQGITALQQRRRELRGQLPRLHGQEYCRALRRMQALLDEEQDMLFALRLLSRLRRPCGERTCGGPDAQSRGEVAAAPAVGTPAVGVTRCV